MDTSMNSPDDRVVSDWPELIGYSAILREQLSKLQPEINPFTVPHLGATGEQIRQAEARLGCPLDVQHRELLQHVNGWPLFFTHTDLLSTDELGQGPLWEKGQQMLDIFYEDGAIPAGYLARQDLMSIAVGEYVTDVFALWRTGPETNRGHLVLWLAGEEIQRFDNVRDWLLSVNQYLKNKIERLGAAPR